MNCKYYNTCSAPLCPMDKDSLEHCAWFPSEEICRCVPSPRWVKRQRKLDKKLSFDNGCFTYQMLQQNCKITPALRGINPDEAEPHSLEDTWIEKHPNNKLSEKQQAAFQKMAVLSRNS